jgi:hypothetical protein
MNCDAIVHSFGSNLKEMIGCYATAVIWADEALHFALSNAA